MPWNPPPLPQQEPDWLTFQVWWQQVIEDIQSQIGGLEDALALIATAQAEAAAVTAAQIQSASHPAGAVVTGAANGATAKIDISSHVRRYPQTDGSIVTVTVDAGSVTGLAYDTFYYIFYDDPTLAGGAVTYQATETAADATQRGPRHTVGGAKTPVDSAAAPVTGAPTRGAGVGTLNADLA